MRTKGSGETVPPAHCATEREAGGMDPGSGFEEERYANSRYTLETKLIGLEGGLHVGVAEEGDEKAIMALRFLE